MVMKEICILQTQQRFKRNYAHSPRKCELSLSRKLLRKCPRNMALREARNGYIHSNISSQNRTSIAIIDCNSNKDCNK